MNGVSVQAKKGKLDRLLFPVSLWSLKFPMKEILKVCVCKQDCLETVKKSQWAGYGIEWVQRKKSKDSVCGLGVEPLKSQSNFILNFLRDRVKQEKLRKIKGEDPKPLPKIWQQRIGGT